MLYPERIKRAFRIFREKNEKAQNASVTENETFTPEVTIEENLEKGDIPAMLLAGFLVIMPIAVVILLVLAVIGFFFLIRG